MKKLALLACGFMCVVFIAATATAHPRLRVPRVDQVARPAVNQKNYKEMRHQKKAYLQSKVRHTTRAPRFVNKPRRQGDIWGANYHRRASTRYYTGRKGSSRASAAARAKLRSRIQSRVNCADGVNCGGVSRSKSPGQRAKSNRSTLNYSDATKRRWQKIFELHAEKWQPPKLKELESGCNDFARCM